MRSNLFLHFLNRDTREVFRLYDTLAVESHRRLLRRALNAAVVLCEDRCIAPPGFVVEDELAFELAEAQKEYLGAGIIQFPMREPSLADYADKKRIGYEPMRSRYSGLFDDTRIGFLGENATGIISRKSHITDRILVDWQEGPEGGRGVWRPVKAALPSQDVDIVARIPIELNEAGVALTWSAIQPQLPEGAKLASPVLRNALQHVYFKQYCREFNLVVLSGIPHIIGDFNLPTNDRVYNYRRLSSFLGTFELAGMFLDGPAETIVRLKRGSGFVAFMDAYASLATISNSHTDLTFFADRAKRSVSFDWASVASRRLQLFELTPIELSELDDALKDAAGRIDQENGFTTRMSHQNKNEERAMALTVRAGDAVEAELVFFVALDEELDILVRSLKLHKNVSTPEASGEIAGVPVEIVCPRNMGRVPAAVAMSYYLANRKTKPRLLIILGIAGGFEENHSEVGNIISATKVVDLAMRKVIDAENGPAPKFRREDFHPDDALSRVLQSSFDVAEWANEACASEVLAWPASRRPSIHYGPMASVDEVVASDKLRGLMIDGSGGSKLLGVEMEAGGACAAARRAGVPFCMLRAISDKADPAKADDGWRRRGMGTIAHLLERLPLGDVLGQVT